MVWGRIEAGGTVAWGGAGTLSARAHVDFMTMSRSAVRAALLTDVRSNQRSQISVREADRLNSKKRELDKKIWDTCG
jgi:hypothetical protein